MEARLRMFVKVAVALVAVIAGIALTAGCWLTRTEETCWKHEAVEAFEKYGSLRDRAAIVRASLTENDDGRDSLEVVEKEPNGCSFGSNGRTIIRFYFDAEKRLTKMQVLRDYMTANDALTLIDERAY